MVLAPGEVEELSVGPVQRSEIAWLSDKVGQLAPLSRSALIIAKRALRLGGRGSLEGWAQALPEMEALYLDDLMNTADAQEGLAAFMEKRSPTWKHE